MGISSTHRRASESRNPGPKVPESLHSVAMEGQISKVDPCGRVGRLPQLFAQVYGLREACVAVLKAATI